VPLLLGKPRNRKEAARLRAQQLFPTADLRHKKDHGRAEALLLAHYGCQGARDTKKLLVLPPHARGTWL
jgi:hypothetical protein